jgi:hypothetical protein
VKHNVPGDSLPPSPLATFAAGDEEGEAGIELKGRS